MAKLILNYFNKFFLKDSVETVHLHTKVYDNITTLSDELYDQIETDAILIRGDNIDTEISKDFLSNIIINIGFLEREYFSYTDLSEISEMLHTNLPFVKSIEEKVNKNLEQVQSYTNNQVGFTIGEGEIVVLSVQEDIEDIEQFLREIKDQGYGLQVIKRSKWISNAGASTFGEEIILWVSNLVVGGIAWDVLKAQVLDRWLGLTKPSFISNVNLNEILIYLSEVTGEPPQSFALGKIETRSENNIIYFFQNHYQRIVLVTDSNNKPLNLEITELSKTRI